MIPIQRIAFRNKQEVMILNFPSFIAKAVGESESLSTLKLQHLEYILASKSIYMHNCEFQCLLCLLFFCVALFMMACLPLPCERS